MQPLSDSEPEAVSSPAYLPSLYLQSYPLRRAYAAAAHHTPDSPDSPDPPPRSPPTRQLSADPPTDAACGIASPIHAAKNAVPPALLPLASALWQPRPAALLSGYTRARAAEALAHALNLRRAEGHCRAVLVLARTDATAKTWREALASALDEVKVTTFSTTPSRKQACLNALRCEQFPGVLVVTEKSVRSASVWEELCAALRQNRVASKWELVVNELRGGDAFLHMYHSPFQMMADKQAENGLFVLCSDDSNRVCKAMFTKEAVNSFVANRIPHLLGDSKIAHWITPKTISKAPREPSTLKSVSNIPTTGKPQQSSSFQKGKAISRIDEFELEQHPSTLRQLENMTINSSKPFQKSSRSKLAKENVSMFDDPAKKKELRPTRTERPRTQKVQKERSITRVISDLAPTPPSDIFDEDSPCLDLFRNRFDSSSEKQSGSQDISDDDIPLLARIQNRRRNAEMGGQSATRVIFDEDATTEILDRVPNRRGTTIEKRLGSPHVSFDSDDSDDIPLPLIERHTPPKPNMLLGKPIKHMPITSADGTASRRGGSMRTILKKEERQAMRVASDLTSMGLNRTSLRKVAFDEDTPLSTLLRNRIKTSSGRQPNSNLAFSGSDDPHDVFKRRLGERKPLPTRRVLAMKPERDGKTKLGKTPIYSQGKQVKVPPSSAKEDPRFVPLPTWRGKSQTAPLEKKPTRASSKIPSYQSSRGCKREDLLEKTKITIHTASKVPEKAYASHAASTKLPVSPQKRRRRSLVTPRRSSTCDTNTLNVRRRDNSSFSIVDFQDESSNDEWHTPPSKFDRPVLRPANAEEVDDVWKTPFTSLSEQRRRGNGNESRPKSAVVRQLLVDENTTIDRSKEFVQPGLNGGTTTYNKRNCPAVGSKSSRQNTKESSRGNRLQNIYLGSKSSEKQVRKSSSGSRVLDIADSDAEVINCDIDVVDLCASTDEEAHDFVHLPEQGGKRAERSKPLVERSGNVSRETDSSRVSERARSVGGQQHRSNGDSSRDRTSSFKRRGRSYNSANLVLTKVTKINPDTRLLSDEHRQLFNKWLRKAQTAEARGIGGYMTAIRLYSKCLELCDESDFLTSRILCLSHETKVLSLKDFVRHSPISKTRGRRFRRRRISDSSN